MTTGPISQTGIGSQLAPCAAVGLLVIAAAATHTAAELTGEQAPTALIVAGTAVVLAVLVATKLGQRIECRKGKARLYAFLSVAATWLSTVTVTGISMGAVAILAALVSAISLHWWRDRRIPNAPATTESTPMGKSEYAARWDEHLGCVGGVLAKSTLTNPQIIESGIRYTLRLVPGKQDHGSVMGAYKNIRGGLGLKRHQDLIIEDHPDLEEPHQLVTIVTKSPIKDEILWPGPVAFDSKTGKIMLGPFADGLGLATWKAYSETRLFGGYIQGGTNGGKSRCMECIAVTLAACESHPTVIMYSDGQGGASSPLLMAKYSDFVALTLEQTKAMLAGLLLVMELRQDENFLLGLSGFKPTAERPGILGFMDECHKYTVDPWVQKTVATIAREGGKVGIALVLASQDPLLSAFGGSGEGNYAETIRSNLLMGNGLIFRSKSKDVKQVFEVDVNPSEFPKSPGYAFVVDADDGARSAPFRCYHFTDQQCAVWPQRITWRSLDAGSANAWGVSYINRAAHAEAERAMRQARVDARKAGMVATYSENTPAFSSPVSSPIGPLPVFPEWTAPAAPAPAPLNPSQQAVLDAVRNGDTAVQAISNTVGLGTTQVYNILKELQSADLIDKPRHGVFIAKAA